MICPACSNKAACLETRTTKAGTRRRYGCACGQRFSTLETLVPSAPKRERPGRPAATDLQSVWMR